MAPPEWRVNQMAVDKKFAGYLCTGCGIGERLDAKQLTMVATREGKMASCKSHPMLCSTEGVQLIRDDVAAGNATHVMIAACSRRAKMEAFNFTDIAMSRANLREGVIWLRPEGDEHQETTQEMADDYVRMACAEVRFMTVPSGSGEQSLNRNLLVVGNGVTAMAFRPGGRQGWLWRPPGV
jgi:quinone-modifying oxidoreductase subunit QmoB